MSEKTTTTDQEPQTKSTDYSLGTRFLEMAAGFGLVAGSVLALPVIGTIGGVVGGVVGVGLAIDGVRNMVGRRSDPPGDTNEDDDDLQSLMPEDPGEQDDDELGTTENQNAPLNNSTEKHDNIDNDVPIPQLGGSGVNPTQDDTPEEVVQENEPQPVNSKQTTEKENDKTESEPTGNELNTPQVTTETVETNTGQSPPEISDTSSKKKREEPEAIALLREQFLAFNKEQATYFSKLENPYKKVAMMLLKVKEVTLRKNVLNALKAQDEQAVQSTLTEYKDAILEARAEIPGLVQVLSKWKRQLDDREISLWQDLAEIDENYKEADKKCREARKTAEQNLGNRDTENRELLEKYDGQRKKQYDIVKDWHDGKHVDLLVDLSEADAQTEGSLAWFEQLRVDITSVVTVVQQPRQPTQEELEWAAVEQDVLQKYTAFKNSKFNYSNGNLRGPSMPQNLRTQAVREIYFLAGNRYQIGGKIYEVGSSDTGGMSLKTEFPKKYQGFNANGGWVKSFIYHLSGTH